jgi:CBS domain-containing protein
MSDKAKYAASDPAQRSAYLNHLVDDLEALEILLAEHRFETGITRIGVEQEMCLIDEGLRPAMLALEILESLRDDHFTTELARFNLELNLEPRTFTADCLSQVESSLGLFLRKANKAAQRRGARVILTGILPTVRDSDITLENMTPIPRYKALNDAIREMRGSDFRFYIRGLDELITSHATVLYEGCNTSFQVHFQIDPARFASQYNWAQAIAAPILSCATNSPLFLGKRLWRETRISLFHLSTDDRSVPSTHRQQRSRVGFGHRWVKGSVVDYFRELVCRHKVLLTPLIKHNSLEELKRARIPKLTALNMLNGTVYPWNRPCYGITDGKPHIRIESRYLPAGPTIVDEVANAALWLGLMNGMPEDCAEVPVRLSFESAHYNFLSAARMGLAAKLDWLDRRSFTAQELLLDALLPIARAGLAKAALAPSDIDKYLGIIEKRISSGKTGSQWMLDSVDRLQPQGTLNEAIAATTEGIYRRQQLGHPVHEWQPSELVEAGDWRHRWSTVEQLMSTDLITVHPDEPIKLVRNILLWSNIRHIPVETAGGQFLGMISMEKLWQRGDFGEALKDICAADAMERHPPTVTPDTPIADALRLMTTANLTCLAVLVNQKLVGVLTERDCLKIARGMLRDASDIAHGK